MTLEVHIESHFVKRVKVLGGMAIKMNIVGTVGLPDRLVFLPGSRVWLVELKRPGGRVRPTQLVTHARLAELGINVAVLSSREEVDEWIAERERES